LKKKEVRSIVSTGYAPIVKWMMLHPEAYLHRTNHPRWTREELPKEGIGLAFFRNTVQYIRKHLL
jgi:hypothetical protein